MPANRKMNPGSTIAHYRITAKLGEGGMGAVYQATDTTLGREVALKFLPDPFTRDPERLQRFEREARLLATLNHPRIGAIYGFERHSDGPPFLVLEFIPGQTLAERLQAGPIDPEFALPLAAQIAEGLEVAHAKGIVHRDLKPANIKITPEGGIKVLDFGLGKALAGDGADASASNSPTRTIEATRAGVILGTAAYMSPEQARGKSTNARTDIWSFGCVLYEMLTARPAFAGETVSDILAGILRGEPDWQGVPSSLRPLLERCLRKDPERRWHHLGDVRLQLEELPAEIKAVPTTAARPPRIAWALASLMTLVAASALGSRWFHAAPALPVERFTIPLPAADPLSRSEQRTVAISRDGTRIAYLADHGGVPRLMQKAMDQAEFEPVPGSEGASNPMLSPNGAWIGFLARGQVMRAPVSGTVARPLTSTSLIGSPSWDEPESLLFAHMTEGIFRIPASGGNAEMVSALDSAQHQVAFLHPHSLPGGGVIYTVDLDSMTSLDDALLAVKFPGSAARVVLTGGSSGCYLPTGHLLYGRNKSLLAAPFDARHGKVTSDPVPVVNGVQTSPSNGAAAFSVSDTGTLVYETAFEQKHSVVLMDRHGAAQTIVTYPNPLTGIALSPDGQLLAIGLVKANNDIHLYDLHRGITSRVTTEGGDKNYPLWMPDGKRIVYSLTAPNGLGLVAKAIDSRAEPETILPPEKSLMVASSVSPDGRTLAYASRGAETQADIWTLSLKGSSEPKPFLRTRFSEGFPVFSPDGQWLAYVSDESGVVQVYAVRFPDGGGRVQISTDGGTAPQWAPNGRELFYTKGDTMLTVPVSTGQVFTVGRPQELFHAKIGLFYAVARDGQHFYVSKDEEGEPIREIHVILNWFEELKRRAPVR